MGNKKWEVEFYEKKNDRCPTEEFLSEISKTDKKDLVLINRAFSRLEEYGIIKKTQKVPDYEIDKAIEYKKDYIARKSKGQMK